MKIRWIIFDMDGVLIDAREWHYESLNAALSLFGTEISRYDHLVTFDGLPTKKKLQMLSLESGFPEKLHQFTNELKQQYTIEIVYARCKPVFQHQFALSKLKAEGYQLAVASNSVRQSIEIMMDKSGLAPYINFFLSNQDVQNSKPHPEIYQSAISKLGLDPQNCLIVEDNDHGVKAAYAAGAHVLKVQNPGDVNYYNIKSFIQEIENA